MIKDYIVKNDEVVNRLRLELDQAKTKATELQTTVTELCQKFFVSAANAFESQELTKR